MTKSAPTPLHVAVDTGGTFTDVGLRDAEGQLMVWKVPSTPAAPDEAVMDGITGALQRCGCTPTDIERLIHGTTVATNTVLTREGARVGLLTTQGFRDVLAIAHQARPKIYDGRVTRPAPLIPDELIIEIEERIDADGKVLTELTSKALKRAAKELKKLKLDVVVVSFLNAYANPQHEAEAARYLTKAKVADIVSPATDITAEMREYDRTSTAAINAYVRPKVSSYMQRLEHNIAQAGVPSKLWVMQSNGGLLDPQTASEHSARTVLSGLAGGVVGAANWARKLNLNRVVSFDIGGTSTDIALIRDGQPDETVATEIDSLPLRLPSVDVHTIGAGGGSIAWIDSGGSLRVGPHSAGAVPGPIAYQRGGDQLTVTDAHVVLGRLGSTLLGGRFELDHDAAHQRMAEFGKSMGLTVEECAEGIVKVITVTMGRGIRAVSVERGVDVRSCHLMAFGGAGPLHGADLAHELGMASAVIPPLPGIASAVGMLDAPIRHDYSAAVSARSAEELAALDADFAKLIDRARHDMASDDIEIEQLVDARYVGQSYELTIPYRADATEQRNVFDDAHEERYGFKDPEAHMEIVVVRLVATISSGAHDMAELVAGSRDPQPKDHRRVYVDGHWLDTPIFDREDIGVGALVSGPAIIDQFDTTTYIRPDQTSQCDEFGFLHIKEEV